MMKILILWLFLFSLKIGLGQTYSHFYKEKLTAAEGQIDLIVSGDEAIIRRFITEVDGHFKYQEGPFASVTISSDQLDRFVSLISTTDVKIGLHYSPPALHNDTMLINNRVDSVHLGSDWLPKGYSGKGVLLGIIDSGIDPNHPDFKDSLGNSRILHLWDQTKPYNAALTPLPYGYGQHWDSAQINLGVCPHDDHPSYFGHGSNVSGAAAGNGNATGAFKGVAYEADLVVVASDFSNLNWTSTVADAVHYIFSKADSLGMPCVINASLGSYAGSHDALDPATQIIENMLLAKPGRVMTASAGNAGNQKFHLGYQVTSDTTFSWFKYNAASYMGSSVYFELWADTGSFENVQFAFGADRVNPSYAFRGMTPFSNIQSRLNQVVIDTLFSSSGFELAIVETWAQQDGSRYYMEVRMMYPDSNQYNYRFITTGSGHFDVWSAAFMGTSNIVGPGLPSSAVFPDILKYRAPDTLQTIVSNWACSPHVITVGNYVNRKSYIDYNLNTQTFATIPGQIAANSSLGPTRKGLLKPDLAASGDLTLAPGRLSALQGMIATEPWKVAPGGFHNRNGGTSMASPVVAGIAALFLERCPSSTSFDIQDALISTSFADGFTGTLPNYSWGNGKANAMSMMGEGRPIATITPSGLYQLCEGDSVFVTASSGLYNLMWNTSDTNLSFYIGASDTLYYTAVDSRTCPAISDTLQVLVNPLPAKPIIDVVMGNQLASIQSAASYQWFLNGLMIPGATTQIHSVFQSGYYQVMITDSFGCSMISDSLYFSMPSVTEIPAFEFSIYPIPGDGYYNYQPAISFEAALTASDGRLVWQGELQDGIIDVRHLAHGIYFLHILYENQRHIMKLIR